MTLSDFWPTFHSHDNIQRPITRLIVSRIWTIERRHFQWPRTTPTPSFKVTSFFDAEYLRNGTTHWHSVIEILIGTYTRPTQQCHFEWLSMTLSNLATYSVTRSIGRTLCDSWASCFTCFDFGLQWNVRYIDILHELCIRQIEWMSKAAVVLDLGISGAYTFLWQNVRDSCRRI